MCQDFDGQLHSLERSERLLAEQADRDAESHRDELSELAERWPMGWPEGHEHGIRSRIKAAEDKATHHRRRADHAGAGYLLVSEHEHRDPEFMGKYQTLIGHGHRLGRVKGSS